MKLAASNLQCTAHNLQRAKCCAIILLILGMTGCSENAQAPLVTTTTTTTLPPPQASLVLGQVDFVKNAANLVDADGILSPGGVAVDQSNRLYIADTENSRVLRYNDVTTLINGGPADIVIGQADFNSYLCNQGGTVGANTLCNPGAVAVDSSGNLYVADTQNNRVMVYTGTISTGMNATIVLGQSDFSTNTNNAGGLGSGSLSAPAGIVVDGSGNLYVADTGNNRVLEYNSPLTIGEAAAVVFGQPDFSSNGSNMGGVSANSLNAPEGVAIDNTGNLYVADSGNNRVLEYNTPLTNAMADIVIGQANFTTNTCTPISNATLCFPVAMVFDAAGNLYVADKNNSRVLEYNAPITTPAMPASTVFGQGGVFTTNTCNKTALNASSLCFPGGIAFDSSSNFYVADTGNSRILQYVTPLTTDTVADIVLGQLAFTTNGINFVDAAGLNTPKGMAVDATTDPDGDSTNGVGILYVSDTRNNRVLGFSNFSAWTTGSSSGGNISTTLNDATKSFTVNQFVNFTIEITGGTGAGQVSTITSNTATQLTVSSAWITIPDATSTYQIMTAASIVIGQPDVNSNQCNQGATTASATSLCGPRGIAVDSLGNLYVADTSNNRMLEYAAPITTGMAASKVFGQSSFTAISCAVPPGAASLCLPIGVAVDSSGNLYVADTSNNRVLTYAAPLTTPGMAATMVFGQANFTNKNCNDTSTAIGGLSANSLCFPEGVALDTPGNLYVADTNNSRVLLYTPAFSTAMAATRVFGHIDFTNLACNDPSTSIGGLSAQSLCFPESVALDSAGNLYVTDTMNNRVLEYDKPFTTGSVAADVFGQPDFASSDCNNPTVTIGGLSDKSLCFPEGVALDSSDNLYIADTQNNRVLQFGPQ